ncbi:MAG: hypothetical protein NT120_00840 [Candidatus Aenigmarchaeota archaeon]|nr:hypothetical protein [Candidatus Aenigmarchaeota archaeon]
MKIGSKAKFIGWVALVIILLAVSFSNVVPITASLIIIVISLGLVLPRDFIKNWKILLWLFFILIAIILIAPNLNPSGFIVTSVGKNATIPGIVAGDIIYKINDINADQNVLSQSYYDLTKIETSKGMRFVKLNGTLGITAEPSPYNNLKFGLDIKGGVRATLEPNTTSNSTLEQIISTLQTRINVYGLRESIFRPVYYQNKGFVEISIAGGTVDELKDLLEKQGKFEAKISLLIPVQNGKAVINLDKKYNIVVGNSSISYDGNTVNVGNNFILSGIPFSLNSISNNLNMTSTVFSGDDIKTVFFDPQRSRLEPVTGGTYKWSFGVQLSSGGAQKFAWITANTKILATGYLDQLIYFYLDDKYIDALNIASSLQGRTETEISISGSAPTKDSAIKSRASLQSILRSGALPTSVQIVQLDTISPTLGIGFLKNAALAGLAAILGIIIVVSARYRHPKLVIPMLFISLSEVLIVLGFSVVIGWTIDLAAIAGIIASVGTGVDSQIIILDRTLRKEEERIETLREKLKNAFFVVFGSAGTVIAAMLPLLFGFPTLRGFAIITIMGVLVGVLIARPAYGTIIEYMTRKEK